MIESYRHRKKDLNVLQEIASFLKASFQVGLKLNGILYLHRISENRLQGSAIQGMKMFRNIIGASVYGNIVLATTMWDSVNLAEGEERKTNLIEHSNFWGMLKQEGYQVRRHKNTKTSAISFFVKERTDEAVLDLQEDLVTKNKNLVDTAAGKEACDKLAEGIERLEEIWKTLRPSYGRH